MGILETEVNSIKPLRMPVIDSFGALGEDSEDVVHTWEKGIIVAEEELVAQVVFSKDFSQPL